MMTPLDEKGRSGLRRFRALPGLVLVSAGALALAACGSKPPKELPPEPGPAVSSTTPASQLGNEGAASGYAANSGPGSPADFIAVLGGRDTIHFAFDQYSIDTPSVAALKAQAAWLLKYPGRSATIEGHADERGTREYNLALGERRANAAKNYLVSLGVDAARLTTVSYGKERPVDPASNEEAWAKNRRAVTVVVQ